MKIHQINNFSNFSNCSVKISLFHVLLTLFFANAGSLQSQNITPDSLPKKSIHVEELNERIVEYNNLNPVEKVYLQTNTDVVSMSETLWYSAYVVLGPYHQYSEVSKVLFVDLIGHDNQIVLSQTIKLTDGKGYGGMEIPKELQSGNYHIRAYTSWMRNFDESFFYYQPIVLINDTNSYAPQNSTGDNINLQFFPEGGHLIEGVNSQVAFKVTNGNGGNKLVTGRVEDSKGNFVTSIETMIEGLGLFYLKPKPEEQYTAIFDDGSRHFLPKVMSRGYVLSINNKDENKIRVSVKATDRLMNNPFYIVADIRGLKHFDESFEFKEKSSVEFEIPKDDLPTGIMTITLFDASGQPFCERPVFINNQEQLVINIKPVFLELKKRAPISLKIKVTDTHGKPVSTNLSIAVTDVSQISRNTYSNNILTQFLVQSELKGHIIDPWLFFVNKDRKTAAKLDLILMTHDWRKYKCSKIENKPSLNKEFEFSKGLKISGTAFGFNHKILANTSLKMIAESNEEVITHSTITDSKGKFRIEGINPIDSVSLFFNAYNSKKRNIRVRVELDEAKKPPAPAYNPDSKISSQRLDGYLAGKIARKRLDAIFKFEDATLLDEAIIKADKKNKPQSPSMYGIVPDVTVYQNEKNPQPIPLLLSSIPGLNVTGIGTITPGINIRGPGSIISPTQPLVILDGMDISAGDGNPFIYINEFDIERIEVLKGPSASIFGARGSNGVILFYSRRGVDYIDNSLEKNPQHTLSYDGQKEFYSPSYHHESQERIKFDYRPTLYWSPSIVTDENGEAEIIFFNSDTANRMQIVINSLSNHGMLGFYFNTFGN